MSKEKGELSQSDLKVGGKWATNLYDKQTPNLVKKLTGAKIQTIDMGLFDIKKNRSKGQQAIELTPAIKRIILSEKPDIKQPSNVALTTEEIQSLKPQRETAIEVQKPSPKKTLTITKAQGKPIPKLQYESNAVKELVIKQNMTRAQAREKVKQKKIVEKKQVDEILKEKDRIEAQNERIRILMAKENAKSEVKKENKITSIKQYLLENEVKKRVKAGTMTNEEAAKARVSGKFNTITKEIYYKLKDKTKRNNIDKAEIIKSVKSDQRFKLFEHGYRLVKKYTKLIGQTSGIVSERNVPRGAKGVAYPTGTIRIKSLNDIPSIVHELTHLIDRYKKFRDTITNKNVINELIDIYKTHYLEIPKGKKGKKFNERKAIIEGLATFIERYAFHQIDTKTNYPNLVKEFINEGGLYNDKLFNNLVEDARNILGQYQNLSDLDKINARIVDNKRNIDKESFWGIKDKMKLYINNRNWLVAKMSELTGKERTDENPALHLESHGKSARIFNHNLSKNSNFKGKLTLGTGETYLSVNNKGVIFIAHDFNIATLVDSLDSENNINDYGSYLLSRDTYYSYKEVEEMIKFINNNKDKISNLEQQYESERNPELKQNIKELEATNIEYTGYLKTKQKILVNRDIPRELAANAFNSNKDRFIEQDKIFDAIIRTQLDEAYAARLVTPKLYDYFIKRKGYAPIHADLIDELTDIPNLASSFIDNASITVRGKRINSLIARKGHLAPTKNPLMQLILNELKNRPKVMQQMIYNSFSDIVNKVLENEKGEFVKVIPDYVANEVEYNPLMKDRGDTIITIDKNFEKHAYKIDKNLKALFDAAFSQKTMNIFRKILVSGAKLFTTSTTGLYMAFGLVNIPLDAITSFVQTKNNLIPILDSLRIAIDYLLKKPKSRQYIKEYFDIASLSNSRIGGIVNAPTLAEQLKIIDPKFAKKYYSTETNKNKLIEVGGKILSGVNKSMDVTGDILGFPSKVTELFPRLTEYVLSRENGNSQLVAFNDAANVTGPFGQRGLIYPVIQPAPYVNASLQIAGTTYESIRRMKQQFQGTKNPTDKTNVILRFSILTAALTAIALKEIVDIKNKLQNAKTDEEKDDAIKATIDYNNMSMYERANFLRISEKGILRVPSNYAVIPNLMAMIAADNYLNSNFTAKEYAELFEESIPSKVNPIDISTYTSYMPYAIKQPILIMLGYRDFPKMKKIESDYLSSKPTEERVYSTTNELAKYIGNSNFVKLWNKNVGEVEQLSPIKIQELINMFGRAWYRQFMGEWDSTKDPIENVFNSYISSIKSSVIRDDYLFSGREFDKFYKDKKDIKNQISKDKKIYEAVIDPKLINPIFSKMNRNDLYNKVSDYMTEIRKIDSAGIEIPPDYINGIYKIVDNLNNKEDKEALKNLMELFTSRDFNNFINNSKLIIDKNEKETIRFNYNKYEFDYD